MVDPAPRVPFTPTGLSQVAASVVAVARGLDDQAARITALEQQLASTTEPTPGKETP